jgi:hypothetical protein
VTFTHRELRVVDKQVFRLGLAANYGIDEAGVRGQLDENLAALEQGPMSADELTLMRELGTAVHG